MNNVVCLLEYNKLEYLVSIQDKATEEGTKIQMRKNKYPISNQRMPSYSPIGGSCSER